MHWPAKKKKKKKNGHDIRNIVRQVKSTITGSGVSSSALVELKFVLI
jgi:hypothetical protein